MKAMLEDPSYNKQEIVAYFTRPGRTINQARISQIANKQIYATINPASPSELQEFLASYRLADIDIKDPLSEETLQKVFQLKPDEECSLSIDENDFVECKKSFSKGSIQEYAKVASALANNRGGYILFGVENNTWKVEGLKDDRFADTDSKEITRTFNDMFAPAIRWTRTFMYRGGKKIGVLFVYEGEAKPTISQKNKKNVSEGEVYYRYVGENTRIRPAELHNIMRERDARIEKRWQDIVTRIGRVGVENVGILNADTGMIEGPGGRFLIAEELIPRIQFIKEGRFSETEGDPTLRLVGDVESVRTVTDSSGQTLYKKLNITDKDLIEDFVFRKKVSGPEEYIKHLAHIQTLWIPIYYYMNMAGIDETATINILEQQDTTYQSARDKQVERVRNARIPTKGAKSDRVKPYRERIITKNKFSIKSGNECKLLCEAIKTLDYQEIDVQFVHELLECTIPFYVKRASVIRTACAYLDYYIYGPGSG